MKLNEIISEAIKLCEEIDFENLPELGPLLEKLEKIVELTAEKEELFNIAKDLKDILDKAIFEEIPSQKAREILYQGLFKLQELSVREEKDPKALLEDLAYKLLTVEPYDLPALGEILKGMEDLAESLSQYPEVQELILLAKKALEKAILEEMGIEEVVGFINEVFRGLQSFLFGEPLSPSLKQKAKDMGLLPKEETEEEPFKKFASLLEGAQKVLLDMASSPKDLGLLGQLKTYFQEMARILKGRAPQGERLCETIAGLLSSETKDLSSDLESFALAIDLLKDLKEGEDLPSSKVEQLINEISQKAIAEKKLLGELLIEQKALKEEDLKEAFEEQKLKPHKKLGEILLEKGKVTTQDLVRALKTQTEGMVSVEIQKLLQLTDLVGELAVLQALIRSNPTFLSVADLKFLQQFEQLGRITSELQKMVMSLRMEPLNEMFHRLSVFAQQMATSLGRNLNIELDLQDTELEVEKKNLLYEVLTRIVRAILEESLQSPSFLKISVQRKTGYINVNIWEDGKGLNPNSLLLQESEKILQALEGTLEIETHQEGTSLNLRIPLTLVVIDGLLAKVGGQWFIIPADCVREIYLPKKENVIFLSGKEEALKIRDELMPIINLHGHLLGKNSKKVWDLVAIVIEKEYKHFAILVDEVKGKQEVVVKNLGKLLRGIRGVVGGSIMGDGSVGLIIEPEELLREEGKESCNPKPLG
jgi:chemotaxis protein histidine kinase CheA